MRLGLVLVVAACGRIGFGEQSPPTDGIVGPIGHDEDGDGVPDRDDVCPHLAGSQLDGDGDGVGDDCDPEPNIGRQRIRLFATLGPADQPFALTGSGTWTQREDSMHLDCTPQAPDVTASGQLVLDPFVAADMRIAFGLDLLTIQNGAVQHQLAILALDGITPYYFGEINEGPGFADAGITEYDGSSYTAAAKTDLPNDIHTGAVTLQTTHFVGTSVGFDGGWEGEPYSSLVPTNDYRGTTHVLFQLLDVEVDVRWVIVIDAP